MICSYLSNSEFGFINIHVEQAYTYIAESALSSVDISSQEKDLQIPDFIGSAIYVNELTITTIVKLINYFNQKTSEFPKFLFFDLISISYIQKNLKYSLKELFDFLKSRKTNIIFLNFSNELESSGNGDDIRYLESFEKLNKDSKQRYNGNDYNSILKIRDYLFNSKKEEKLIHSFDKQNPPYLHDSSSVYLTQYFNFKKFIAEDGFVYYCLYLLALKMLEKNASHAWSITPYSNTSLFCQTLNGSFLGSVLADLLGINLFLIDHLGPINKIYTSKYHSEIDTESNYIVISDVLCLGTEVKNAKSIIEYSGARYLGNVAFLRVESRQKKDADFKDIEFFYRIDNDYNPVNYSIRTELSKK